VKKPISAGDKRRKVELLAFFLALPWLTVTRSHPRAQDTSVPQGQPAHHIFTPFSMAKTMPMRGALRASVHTFKTEDGILVLQSDDGYKSASAADSGLNTLMKNASRVIRQSTKTDAKGTVVGKRVELVLNRGPGASPEMVIAWTDGADLVRLTSTSMPLLLDFERQYYPAAEQDKERLIR
jgi:hypothetical protein